MLAKLSTTAIGLGLGLFLMTREAQAQSSVADLYSNGTKGSCEGFQLWGQEVSQTGALGDPINFLGQLPNGQVRFGNGLQPVRFSLRNGTLYDASSRVCDFVGAEQVLVCSAGAANVGRFHFDCKGNWRQQAPGAACWESSLWVCRTGEGDQRNVYRQPLDAQCRRITLTAPGRECSCTHYRGRLDVQCPADNAPSYFTDRRPPPAKTGRPGVVVVVTDTKAVSAVTPPVASPVVVTATATVYARGGRWP